MKCLPRSKIPQANGNVLHDWHAEILAIRAFNRFLVDECAELAASELTETLIIRHREQNERTDAEFQPFDVKDDIEIHMYCSEAPCGDASMELTMDSQEDATPWPLSSHVEASMNATEDNDAELHGRGHFSELGVVRRKPARADASVTWSKSCSDKLALKQCTSLLNTTTSLLVSPRNVFLTSVILPHSQTNHTGTERAFSALGRMSEVIRPMSRFESSGYRFQPFKIAGTSLEFEWSRRNVRKDEKLTASNISSVYTPKHEETIINGVLLGRKQSDPLGASAISRRSMWRAVANVVGLVETPLLRRASDVEAFAELKNNPVFNNRRAVKNMARQTALKGWTVNSGDDEFTTGATP